MKPLVYIAGPYTNPDPVLNTRNAIKVGAEIWRQHQVPVLIPHLTMFMHFLQPMSLDGWYEFDKAQLEHCDALLRLPGPSTGADMEVEFAECNDIPVFYYLETLEDWLANFDE
jgi:hypothetical protein